jgi:hypothetical protein
MAEALVNQRDDAAQHHRLRRHQRHLHLRSGNTRLQAGECVRHETQRQAGTQAQRRARRQADPVDRKHRCGDCLAARFRRMLDRPAEPVRPLQSVGANGRAPQPASPDLTAAGEAVRRWQAQRTARKVDGGACRTTDGGTRATSSPGLGSPLPYLRWDCDWAWAGTA